MEEEKILLDIEFNNAEVKDAIKNISAGRKAIDELIESNKQLAAQGQKNSAEYVKNQEAIRALNAEVNQNSKIVQANVQAQKASAESLEKVRAENVLLLAERKKLSREDAEQSKRIDEINTALDKNNAFIDANVSKQEKQTRNIGNYSSALAGVHPQLGMFATNLGSAQKETGTLTGGIGQMTKAALGFIATPFGAVLAAIVIGLKLLSTWLTNTTEGVDFLEDAASVAGATIDVLKDNIGKLIDIMGDFFTFDFKGVIDGFSEIGDEISREVSLTLELNEAIRDLEDAEINFEISASKTANTIKTLLLQSKNRTLSEKDRIALLDQAAKLEDEQSKQLIKNRERALQIANDEANKKVEIARITGESEAEFAQRLIDTGVLLDDQRDKVKDAIIAFNNALGESISVQEKIQNQSDALAEKAEQRAAKEEEERQKRAEAEKKRLEDIEKKKEEIREREATAANELELLRLEQQAREIQGIQNQTDALIDLEQRRAEQLLENEELTQSERQKIILESEEAINQILLESREREEFERQAGLENSLADFTEYTQGLINAEKEKYLQGIISKEEYDQQINDLELAALETQLAIKEAAGEKDLALQGRITDYKIALGEKEVQAKKAQEEAKINAVQNAIGTIANAFNKQSVAYKVLASTQTLIDTIRGAFNVYTGMTATIPGPVGIVLGLAAAAATTASGIAAVSKINSTPVPKLEEGGLMDLAGPRHSQGGMDVHVGGKKVANVEGGERMVILKRGASPSLLKDLSTVNMLAGGRDFFADRTPRYHNLDGGFIARSAASQASGTNTRDINQQVAQTKIYTRVTDIQRVESNMELAEIVSELR